jgi:hypothetical protein
MLAVDADGEVRYLPAALAGATTFAVAATLAGAATPTALAPAGRSRSRGGNGFAGG